MKKVIMIGLIITTVFSLCSCNLLDTPAPASSTVTLKTPDELQGHITEGTTDFTADDELTHVIYSDSYNASDVRDFILDAVFGPNHNGEVTRWTHTVEYFVTGRPSRADLDAVEYLTEAFKHIDNFPDVRAAESEAKANLIINYADYGDFKESHTTTTSYYSGESVTELVPVESPNVKSTRTVTSSQNSGEIIEASIKLAVSNASERERWNALAKELMHISGMLYYSDVYKESILSVSAGSNQKEPSEIDYLAMGILYDSNILAGSQYAECFVDVDRILLGETTTGITITTSNY